MISSEQISTDDENEFDIIRICRLVWSHRNLIAALTVLGGLVSAAFALTATPVYRAEVVVTAVRDQGMGVAQGLASQLGGLASLAGVSLGAADGASREAQAVLQSRLLVEEFITLHKLLPQILPEAKASPTLWQAVKRFRSDLLHIREDTRKGVTTIGIDATDPVIASRWANDFVALANEHIRTRAIDNANRNIGYLNEQLARTRVVEVQRVMYNIIETETKTLMLANSRAEYAFAVVDPAVPPENRVSPQRTLMVLIGLVSGFIVGILVANVQDMLVRRRRSIGQNL